MRLLPIAKKQGLVLQRSRLGLVSALRPTVLFFYPLALVRRGAAQPCIKKPQIAVVLGYWSQK